MIALDTNILVRFAAEPSTQQGQAARSLLLEQLSPDRPGFISVLALAETIWVLTDKYRASTDSVREVVTRLLGAAEIIIEHADAIERALLLPHKDLADCILHEVGRGVGCTHTLTFDRRFARLDGAKLVS